jgi:hypothetical protein
MLHMSILGGLKQTNRPCQKRPPPGEKETEGISRAQNIGDQHDASVTWQFHPAMSTGFRKAREEEKEEQLPSFWLGQVGRCWPICHDGDYWL